MNSALVAVLTVLVLAAEGHPTFRKKFDQVVHANPCLEGCMNDVHKSDLELNVVRTVDYANYFLNLENICGIIKTARDCIAQCNTASNPFNLKSMTVMCSPNVIEEAKKYTQCMKEEGETVLRVCGHQCGDIKKVNKEIETQTVEMNNENKADKEKLDTIMRKTNQACGMTKCFARCSRNNFASACHHLHHEEAGDFVYAFVKSVNEALVTDVEEQKLVEIMMRSSPPQCNYMYTRGVLFNNTADSIMLRQVYTEIEQRNEINKGKTHKAISPSADDDLQQLQRRILMKELEILEKREQILAKESHKLDVELAIDVERAHQTFF